MTKKLDEQERVHILFEKYLDKSITGQIRKETLMDLEKAISNKYRETQEKYINWIFNHDEMQKSLIQEMLYIESVFNDIKDAINYEKNKIFYNLTTERGELINKFKHAMKYVVENKSLDESFLEAIYKRFQEQVAKMYTEYYLEQLDNLKRELEQPLENLNMNFNQLDSKAKFNVESFFKIEKVLPQSATILAGMDKLFSNPIGWGELLADTAISFLEGAFSSTIKVSFQETRQKKVLDQINPKIEEYVKELQKYLNMNFKETINSIEQSVLDLELKQIEYISEQQTKLLDDIKKQSNMYEEQLKILSDDLDFIQSMGKEMGINLISNIKKLQPFDEEINSLYKLNMQRVLELLDVKKNREQNR